MAKQYDLLALGTGTAASAAASRCRGAGWRVAVVDHQPFGGTCQLRGCDPKKVLVGAAAAIDHDRRLAGKGVLGPARPEIDWPGLLRFKESFTADVPQAKERSFADSGIDAYHGRARFTGTNSVEIAGETIESRFILIATGAVPMRLGIAGEELLATSTDFLNLRDLPARIVFIGGGYIAAELAHVAARAGARVIVLERSDRTLAPFDADLVAWLMERTRALGIDLRTGTRVDSVARDGATFVVRATGPGGQETLPADLVVHAAGRVPDLEPLDLPAAGVRTEKGRLALNGHLQSVSNPSVYAAGDAAAKGPPLTPVAGRDGRIAARNMLEGNVAVPDYLGVPSVVFTIPPLAAVGMGEREAGERGLKFRVRQQRAPDWYTARQAAESAYGFKVLVEEETDRILGAHLLGPDAAEVINLFALAIRQGLRAETLRDAVFAYPTGASDIAYML